MFPRVTCAGSSGHSQLLRPNSVSGQMDPLFVLSCMAYVSLPTVTSEKWMRLPHIEVLFVKC